MDRPAIVGSAFGLLFGLYFAAVVFGGPLGSDIVPVVLLLLLGLAAFTLDRWAWAGAPRSVFQAGLRFGSAASAVLVASLLALAGAGVWSLSSDPLRTGFAFAGFLLAFAVGAVGLAGLSLLGSRALRRGGPTA